MTKLYSIETLSKLKPGDTVRHISSSESMIVTANYGDRVTAVRTADISNAKEWFLVKPDKQK